MGSNGDHAAGGPTLLYPPCPQSAPGIQELLDVAKQDIPFDFWKATPLVLKATAGLRLLPGEKAQKLLRKVSASASPKGWLMIAKTVQHPSTPEQAPGEGLTGRKRVDMLAVSPQVGACGCMTLFFLEMFKAIHVF